MRAQAFENIAIMLSNATSQRQRDVLSAKLRILVDRKDSDRSASVIRELVNQKVELHDVVCNNS